MGRKLTTPDKVIYVCTGSSCKHKGGKQLKKAFATLVKIHGLKNEVEVIKTGCTDRCKMAPIVCFQPDNDWILQADFKDAEAMFREKIQDQEVKK